MSTHAGYRFPRKISVSQRQFRDTSFASSLRANITRRAAARALGLRSIRAHADAVDETLRLVSVDEPLPDRQAECADGFARASEGGVAVVGVEGVVARAAGTGDAAEGGDAVHDVHFAAEGLPAVGAGLHD